MRRGRQKEQERGDGRTSISPSPRLVPISPPRPAPAIPAAPSGRSLSVRVWKILAPLTRSIDVRRDSLVEPTIVDRDESTDCRDPFPGAVVVDSPFIGDDVDPRPPLLSLRENDLLRRGRAAFESASMCSYTDKQAT